MDSFSQRFQSFEQILEFYLCFKKVDYCHALVHLNRYIMFGSYSKKTELLYDLDQIIKDNELTEEQKVTKFLRLRLFHESILKRLVVIFDLLFSE